MGDTFAITVAVVASAVACAHPAAWGDERRSVAEVHALRETAIASRPHTVIRGQIIAISASTGAREAVLEDATGGIRIVGIETADLEGDGSPAGGLVVGDIVEVQGEVEAGHVGRLLRALRIVRFDTAPLPTPRLCDVAAFFEGRENNRLVAVEGIIERAWHDGGDVLLELQAAGRLFTATVPADVAAAIPEIADDPLSLVDAVVRVAGPSESEYNARGEVIRPGLRVDRPAWLTTVEPAATGIVFSQVAVSPDAIGRASTQIRPGHRVYSYGQVIHAVPRRLLFLQNGHHGVEVRLAAGAVAYEERFAPGDRVEVAGFVDRSGAVAFIRNAAVRRIAAGTPPTPLLATPEMILAANGGVSQPEMIPSPGDYQGCLVCCVGRLVQSQPGDEGGSMLVDCNGVVVSVEADPAVFAKLAQTPLRSRVRMNGVALVERQLADGGASTAAPRMRMLLRFADDFQVLEAPPWWTATRLLMLLGATAAFLVAAVVWAVTLRRQLATQTQRLTLEMRSRRDAALEFEATLRERNRLAANLHDTLQQTIAGIGFQLDACEITGTAADATAGQHLAVARRMVNHAAKELQGSVWAMRSLPLEGKPFSEALTALVFRICEGHDVRPTVDAEGPMVNLPEFVAGSILLIVQEAVHNALTHAGPSRIEVRVLDGAEDGTLSVRVEDDGTGFRVGSQPGPREGHFGIQGMRERAERLGGRLVVRHRPGGGTIVEATVERRDYDTEIDAPPAG